MMQRVLLVALAGALPAWADTVVFKSGARLEGITTPRGDVVEVRVPEGAITFNRSVIERIDPGKTSLQEYEERSKHLAANDAAGHYQLGEFCITRGLKQQATAQFQATVAIDPNHAGARSRLGFYLFKGKWLTSDQFYTQLGFVRSRGEWMSPNAARTLADLESHANILADQLTQARRDVAQLQHHLDTSRTESALARESERQLQEKLQVQPPPPPPPEPQYYYPVLIAPFARNPINGLPYNPINGLPYGRSPVVPAPNPQQNHAKAGGR
jgi:hypothetical protein